MKRNVIYILLALVFFIVSCEKEQKYETFNLGAEIAISDDGYTSLDNEVTLNIVGYGLTQVLAYHEGGLEADEETTFDAPTASLGTVTLTAEEGSLVLTDTQLGMTEIGWSADFSFDAVSPTGYPFTRSYTLTVDDPISVEDPGVTHRSDTTFYFTFAIEPATETVETVSVQTKINLAGTYVDAAGGPFNAEDSISIDGSAYNIDDTLYVKVEGTVTGTEGIKTATTATKVTISPISYEDVAAFKLDTTTDLSYDLIKARYVESTIAFGDSADVEFITAPTAGGYDFGFTALNNAVFIVSDAYAYTAGDIYDAENTDFSTPDTPDDLSIGDVYVFRTDRGGTYSFGYIKVVDAFLPHDDEAGASVFLEIKYNAPE